MLAIRSVTFAILELYVALNKEKVDACIGKLFLYFPCSWWKIAGHLKWSLLGMSSRQLFSLDDSSSTTLGYLLYTLFLVMGVILLINILIALLSNTYQQVQVTRHYFSMVCP